MALLIVILPEVIRSYPHNVSSQEKSLSEKVLKAL